MTPTFSSEKYGTLLSQYQPKLIRTEAENQRALTIIADLMHRSDRSAEETELYELLITLTEKFEQEFYQPGTRATPQATLQFLLEQQSLTVAEIANIFGSETLAIEVLEGQREMSISQLKLLSQRLKVEPEIFIQ